VGIYGVFNVLSNIVVSELSIKRLILAMSLGRIISGIGLLAMSFSADLRFIMICAAFSAIGAPVTQIPLATLLQSSFESNDVVRVFRMRIFYEWTFILLALLLAPTGLRELGSGKVILVTATLYLALGLIGLKITKDTDSFDRHATLTAITE
jgi:hypothetical protein